MASAEDAARERLLKGFRAVEAAAEGLGFERREETAEFREAKARLADRISRTGEWDAMMPTEKAIYSMLLDACHPGAFTLFGRFLTSVSHRAIGEVHGAAAMALGPKVKELFVHLGWAALAFPRAPFSTASAVYELIDPG